MKLLSGALAVVLILASLPASRAVTCFAVNEGNMLYRFDSATPSTTTATAISGLPGGYRIVGLDFRTTTKTTGAANPGKGSLWALGTDGTLIKLFVINTTTAAASLIGNVPGITDLAGSDNGWFFGFDPAADKLRIMNFIWNYEVDPNTLATIKQSDVDNFPALNGSAYTEASFGGTSSIFFLEQNNDGLNTSSNISTGAYTALPTPMNVAFSQPAGLDIGEGVMLASMFNTNGGTNKQQLFSVTTGGVFSLIGDISASPGALSLRALAIQPTSFPPKLPVTVRVKGPKKITTEKPFVKIKGIAKSDAGISKVEYKLDKGKFRKAKGTKKWRAKVKVRPGTHKILVRAIGDNDVESKTARIKVFAQ